MQERKRKESGVRIYLFTTFLIISTIFLPCRSFAGEMEILLDKLVNKGILTKSESEILLKEMKEMKEVEKGKAESKKPKLKQNRLKAKRKKVNPQNG